MTEEQSLNSFYKKNIPIITFLSDTQFKAIKSILIQTTALKVLEYQSSLLSFIDINIQNLFQRYLYYFFYLSCVKEEVEGLLSKILQHNNH